ncbi:hypothetical protein Cpir12675_000423 [Ceratocystis pirilliformis]|uniref:OmpA-like domain-containing protein n=1 Tax=Ceratocystis pirilliformis TaxID=259994 RepID=A0ABR3ZM67_9PEZI
MSSHTATGRVRKANRRATLKVIPERREDSVLAHKGPSLKDRLRSMAEEKKLFPASTTWHIDETSLFEALYLRQYRPLVPASWDTQLRGVPIPEFCFCRNLTDQGQFGAPPIYSTQNTEYRASKAFIEIIDLTTNVRALRHLDRHAAIPSYLKDELEKYLMWAAQDGEYHKSRAVPNIFCEIVDTSLSVEGIASHITSKMLQVAKQHRRFWRKHSYKDSNGNTVAVDCPVVYGLFVLNHTVLVLTVDPNRSSHTPVSYQIEIDFSQRSQGIWNALTLGITSCMARDGMVAREEFFSRK